jgi:hypothetical protein
VITAPALGFANYVEDQPRYQPPPVIIQDWIQPPAHAKKPPRPAVQEGGIWETLRRCVPGGQAVRGLDDTYLIENRPVVSRFIEEHRLHGLLLQAKEPLTTRFGKNSIKTLSLICDDEGFETLFCVVSISGDLREQRDALRAFDRDWWLENVRQAAGRLNFDFQLVNAIRL